MPFRLPHEGGWATLPDGWALLDGGSENPERRPREGLEVVEGEGVVKKEEEEPLPTVVLADADTREVLSKLDQLLAGMSDIGERVKFIERDVSEVKQLLGTTSADLYERLGRLEERVDRLDGGLRKKPTKKPESP